MLRSYLSKINAAKSTNWHNPFEFRDKNLPSSYASGLVRSYSSQPFSIGSLLYREHSVESGDASHFLVSFSIFP